MTNLSKLASTLHLFLPFYVQPQTSTQNSCLAMSSIAHSAFSRLVHGKDDALFGSIEEQQGERPFGSILDAGTGLHSLRWMGTLKSKGMTNFTAITADKTMQRNVQVEADALGMLDQGEVIIGNWFDPQTPLDLQLTEKYDTIIADYLDGAMDGFSPYQQDQMFAKLASLLKPSGKLYIVGLEPIPDTCPGDSKIICKVRQVRDSCILLAGHRCYREYPVEWIHRQIEALPGLELQHSSQFPILYRHETIVKQINVGRSKLPLFGTPDLASSMAKVLDDLEQQSLEATQRSPTGRLTLGFDYVVSAEKQSTL
jgi:hypothetical protein